MSKGRNWGQTRFSEILVRDKSRAGFMMASTVHSPHKGQWRGALMFVWSAPWINGWINNRGSGYLRRVLYIHYSDVILTPIASQITNLTIVYSAVYLRRRSKKTSTLRVTGLCVGNSPVTGEFSAQRASNAENVSIWWRHNVLWPPWIHVSAMLCMHRKANIDMVR